MGALEVSLVGLAMLAGLLAVPVPGVPAPLVCWAAVLWWASATHTAAAWYLLAGSAVVLVAGQVLRRRAPGRGLRDSGVGRRDLVAAGVWGIAGFCVLPLAGAVLGFTGCLYARLRSRHGGPGAAAATRLAMRRAGFAVLAELLSCLVVAGAWVTVAAAG